MSDGTRKPIFAYILILSSIQFAAGYENVYDMIEKRNQGGSFFSSEPRSRFSDRTDLFVSRHSGGDRFSSRRTPSSIFGAIRSDDRSSSFGNGYDNIGNGLTERRFGDSRRFDTMRDWDRFDSFDRDRSTDRYREPFYNRRSYSSSFSDDQPYRRTYQKRYNNDEPQFYKRDYFVRPRIEEKSIDLERKNVDQNYESASGQKGLAGLSKTDSLVSTNEDKKQKKSDAGFRSNQEGSHMDVSNKDNFGESSRFDKNGENKSTLRSNKVVKKGHSTKGFSSHHHKDETGNTTTFFDESNDQGGQTDYRDIADEYGTRKTSEQSSGKEEGKYLKENGGQSGNFGSGYLQDNQKYEKDVVSNDNSYDEEKRFGGGGELADVDIRRNSHHLTGGRFGMSDPGLHYERFY